MVGCSKTHLLLNKTQRKQKLWIVEDGVMNCLHWKWCRGHWSPVWQDFVQLNWIWLSTLGQSTYCPCICVISWRELSVVNNYCLHLQNFSNKSIFFYTNEEWNCVSVTWKGKFVIYVPAGTSGTNILVWTFDPCTPLAGPSVICAGQHDTLNSCCCQSS